MINTIVGLLTGYILAHAIIELRKSKRRKKAEREYRASVHKKYSIITGINYRDKTNIGEKCQH